jgi:hypothetical protein
MDVYLSVNSEDSICGVRKGLQSFTMDMVFHALQTKASEPCKIQVTDLVPVPRFCTLGKASRSVCGKNSADVNSSI